MLALITGASAGIGQSMARCFARDGHDVILVARRAEVLDELAQELSAAHGITAHPIPCDLGEPGAALELFEAVQERGLSVDALVNNAGIGQHGAFAQSDQATLSSMLMLNVVALTELTRLFLPQLLERERAHLLNVGSVAGFPPGPGMAAYYATKAYVYSLTEALIEELRGTSVHVTNLAPGPTYTEFQDRAGVADALLFRLGAMEADRVARAGYRGMLKGQGLVIPGVKNKVMAGGAPLVPRGLIRRITAKVNAKKG